MEVNNKKRERSEEVDGKPLDESLTKKPKVGDSNVKGDAPKVVDPIEDDPFLRMVKCGTLQQMKDAITHKDDEKLGLARWRLSNATCIAVEGNHAMKLAVLLQEPALVYIDFHNMIQVACQQGAYQALAVVLADDRLYEQKYMTEIRWGGLFSELFDEVSQKNLRMCKTQLICLTMLAEKHECRKMFEFCMKHLNLSISNPMYGLDGSEKAIIPLGHELPLYKFLSPWLL